MNISEEYREAGIRDVLAARDARQALQNELRDRYKCALVCLSMNIAGPVKRDEWVDRAFAEGKRRISDTLARIGAPVLCAREASGIAGNYAVWATTCDADILKKRMCSIEDDGDIGRLFDIDVLGADGVKRSRDCARKCLLCGNDAFFCARSRAHTWQALSERAHEIIQKYFDTKHALRMGMLAQRALLHEAVVTPKPGLVDCENNGAHADMDLFTMLDGACVLRPYFDGCALEGMRHRGDCAAAYDGIVCLGIRAESDMYAMCGTNTHKGAIFALGILCCAAGMAGEDARRRDVLALAKKIAARSLSHFEGMRAENAHTGGERQYVQMGLTGARGEAAAGFANAVSALRVFEEAKDAGNGENDCALRALVHLIANVPDSNILRRGGEDALRDAMNDAGRLLQNGFTTDDLRDMNDRFVRMNISPGGCADLLAVALFLSNIPE